LPKKKYIKNEDRHKIIDGIVHKWCLNCDKWLPMDEEHFKNHPSRLDGFSDKCIECNKKHNREYYNQTREHQIA
jgi:hypothetical protein